MVQTRQTRNEMENRGLMKTTAEEQVRSNRRAAQLQKCTTLWIDHAATSSVRGEMASGDPIGRAAAALARGLWVRGKRDTTAYGRLRITCVFIPFSQCMREFIQR
ncbi:hypothetical protein QTP88_001591 [Uroleucon formosanum]